MSSSAIRGDFISDAFALKNFVLLFLDRYQIHVRIIAAEEMI